jgi:hypothetical protein
MLLAGGRPKPKNARGCENGQEVTAVKSLTTQRPSMPPAALAQVVVVPARSAAPTAHVDVVGWPAVRTMTTGGNPRLRVPTQPSRRQSVQCLLATGENGTTGGFAGKDIDGRNCIVNGASGVPPRGRPV